jgi:TolA-binding protein
MRRSPRWSTMSAALPLTGCSIVLLVHLAGCSGSEEMIQQQQKITEYEQQLEGLRTENTTLRQRMFKLEQDNKTLEARLSDSETKVIAERARAEKAEAELSVVKTAPAPEPKRPAPKPQPAQQEPTPASTGPASYSDALKAAQSQRYDEAISMFQRLLTTVGDDLKDNCHYWLGECYFAKKQFSEAIKQFEMAMKFSKSEKIADAHYMMAQSYERMGQKAKAKEHYDIVVKL